VAPFIATLCVSCYNQKEAGPRPANDDHDHRQSLLHSKKEVTLLVKKYRTLCAVLLTALLLTFSVTALARYDTLRLGDRSASVTQMQRALSQLGYQVTADGIFGRNTLAAVLAFQKDHDLKADGLAGDATLTRLYQLTGTTAQVTPAPAPRTDTVLRSGSTGPEVTALQQALNALGYAVSIDGVYSTLTQDAVRQFQADYGLKIDGAAGSATLSLIEQLTDNMGTTARVETPLGGTLTLRETRSTRAAALELIPNHTVLSITQRSSTWCKAVYNGQSGYVLTQYLDFDYAGSAAPVVVTASPATAAPVVTAAPAIVQTARVETPQGGTLTLREIRKTTSAALAFIPNYTLLSITERGATWCQAVFAGQTGYVLTKYLNFNYYNEPLATAAPTPAKQEGQLTAQVSTANGNALNMRAYADTNSKVVTIIPYGAYVTVTSRGIVWSAVSYNGYSGYCMTGYLDFGVPAATATPAPVYSQPTDAPGYTAQLARIRTQGSALNVRSTPYMGDNILTSLQNGTYVTATNFSGEWTRITAGRYAGWVMSQYLELLGNGPSATQTPAYIILPTAAPTQQIVIPLPTQTPAGYDQSLFTRTLRANYTGRDVTALQERLKALNYKVSVTGVYDTQTMDAVRQFQRLHGLTQDGLAGVRTFTALYSQGVQAYSEALDSLETLHIYYRTDTADAAQVTRLQQALAGLGYNVTVSGRFDELTHNAVAQFQMRNAGLTVSGAADAATQTVLFSGSGKPATAAPSVSLAVTEGVEALPDTQSIGLLHWYNVVKPSLRTGNTLKIQDPGTGITFSLRVLSCGHHCDSEPWTLRDTLLMNRAFGKTGWTCHPVYVQLPDGRWTMAAMHNRPHLSGGVSGNGFDGHLCVHFLRDMSEAETNDPGYGVTMQTTLRSAWKNLTGVTVP